jgi:plastocyanin
VTRRAAPCAVAALLLGLVLVPLLGVGPAVAAAKTITIDLTAAGPKPASVTAAVGDSVVFHNADATFVHEVASKSTNWRFDTGPMAPGQSVAVGRLTKAGEYVYQGVNLDTFTGKVVVPAASSPAPAASRTASPAASRSAAPSAAPSAPGASASPTSGSGVVGPPPLAGGVIPGPSAPAGSGGPAPNVAPTLPGEEIASAGPTGGAVAIGRGRLPEPPTGRRYGLPAALAAVAAAGVASLLVRLLLAHPAARRAKHARGRSNVSVSVD